MRCNPSYWLLGLVPIAMLSWAAVQLEHEGIEADLGRRAQEILQRSGLDWASATFSGRDGILTGKASDEKDLPRALSHVRDTWGVRVAGSRAELLELVDKFVWSATSRGDGRIVLSGYAPNEEAHKVIVNSANAEFAKSEIIDETKLARGAPDRDAWISGATFALKQLAQLKKGVAELDGLDLSVEGEAATPPAYKSVKAALAKSVPAGVKLAMEKVTPPLISPYVWSAKASNGQVSLAGYAPTEKAREAVSAEAKKAFSKSAPADRTEIGDGAPEGFVETASVALAQLALLKSGVAELRGKDLAFMGEATDETTAQAIRKALKTAIPANYRINDQIKYPKPETPSASGTYVMSINHDGTGVEVSGNVPGEAAHAAMIDAVKARFPGRAVTDKLTVLAGAPEGWQQCFVSGLAALPRLKSGTSVLTDRKLVVTGTTDDYGAFQSVPADVKAGVGQTCESEVNISFTGVMPTNLTWHAANDGAGNLTLDGEIPDETTRTRLTEAAQKLFPKSKIADQMKVRASPAEPWAAVALRGLENLSRLTRGEATLSAKELRVEGIADNQDTAAVVRKAIGTGLPQGFTGKDAIEVASKRSISIEPIAEADRCQDMMRDTAAAGTIQFARAKADLTPESTQTLKELASIANACPAFRIEIDGHTDAEGTDERNQRLSDRRARAVADFLARNGVDARRLTAVGYGATQPIADNETEEGRAKNRRIEFKVN
jgi:outer membrane protein OmpA-like peptidoglycan-associated protein